MSTPAGWYDDGSRQKRWWDGSGWTTHVAAPAAPAPASAEPAPFVPPYAPPLAPPVPTAPSGASPTSAPQYPSAPAYPSAQAYPAAQAPPAAQAYPQYPAAPHASATQYSPYPTAPGMPVSYDGYALPSAAPAPFPAVGLAGLIAAALGTIVACIPQIPLIGWLLLGAGFVLSIVSLFLRARKWAGVAGLAVAVLGALLAAVLSFVLVGSFSASGSAGDDVPGSEVVYASDLEVGDCLPEGLDGEEFFEVTIVPCDGPHIDEIYYEFDLPDGEFPGEDGLTEAAIRECEPQFEEFAGIAYEESELNYWWLTPTETSWAGGDRTMQCLIYDYDGSTVTGTLEGAAR